MSRSTLDTGMCASHVDNSAPIDCRTCGMSAQDCRDVPLLPCCHACDHKPPTLDVEALLCAG